MLKRVTSLLLCLILCLGLTNAALAASYDYYVDAGDTSVDISIPGAADGQAYYLCSVGMNGATVYVFDAVVSGEKVTVQLPKGLVDGNLLYVEIGANTYTVYVGASSTKLDTPTASFDAATMLLSGVTASMQYSVDGGTTWVSITGTTADLSAETLTVTNGIQVINKGNGTSTLDSDPQTITLTQADQPTSVDKTDETAAGADDGSLTGLTTNMEYKLSTASGWTACTGNTVTGLAPGTYQVRVKGAGTVLASDPVDLVVSAYVDPGTTTYTITASAGTGGSISPSGSVSVNKGGSQTFTITANTNYSIADVKVDGTSVGKVKSYTFSNVTGGHTIAASFTYTGSPGGGSGDGGGGGSASYSVTVNKPTGGTVKVSPTSASKGDTVTITVTPDSGYELDELTATDRNGKEITLTNKGDGKYTFTMPGSKVTVDASFAKIHEEAPVNPFTDVAPGSYYYDAVLWAVDEGVTNGTSATTFSPDADCTRAQIVTFLWRAAGSPEPTSTICPFTDVDVSSYYGKAVLWAVENGITNGTDADSFSPNAICTRAQIVTFLWRAAGSPEPTSTYCPFTDVDVDSYYGKAVLWAVENGITNGTSATTFSPNDNCTRAQIVTFLWRFMGN